MARQCTKILICTKNQNNANKINEHLKKIKSIKLEIYFENNPEEILPTFRNDGFDFLIFDQTSFSKESSTYIDFFLNCEWNFPCLIVADQKVENLLEKLKEKNILYSIIPFDWLSPDILGLSIQRLMNLQKKIKNQLQENEEKINIIVKHMDEGVFLVDEKGVIIKWNNAMERIIAVSREEAIGISITELIDRLAKQSMIRMNANLVDNTRETALIKPSPNQFKQTWEGEILTPQGDYRIFQAESFVVNTSKENHIAVILRDVDEQKHHEKELRFLLDLASIIRQSLNDVVKVRKSICEILIDLLFLDSIMMVTFCENKDIGNIVEAHGNLKLKTGMPVSWKECISQKPLYDKSIFEISERCLEQLGEYAGSSSFPATKIIIPLINRNDHVGMLILFRDKPFNEYDYRLLDAVANVVASALNQAVIFERTEIRLKRMESLHVVDQAISGLFNLDLTNRIILDQAKQYLEADGGDILVLNIATNMMEYSAVFGINQLDTDEKRVHLGRSMAGQVLLTREPCIFPDIGKDELPFIMKHLKRYGFKSYFSFPLVAKGEPKGVLELYKNDPFQPDAEWINFLQALSTQASIAIDNVQLFEKIRNIQIL